MVLIFFTTSTVCDISLCVLSTRLGSFHEENITEMSVCARLCVRVFVCVCVFMFVCGGGGGCVCAQMHRHMDGISRNHLNCSGPVSLITRYTSIPVSLSLTLVLCFCLPLVQLIENKVCVYMSSSA